MAKSVPTIGVLALQGNYDAHGRPLEALGAARHTRPPAGGFKLDGLVIPGGESTTMLKLLPQGLFDALRDFVNTKPTFGTCAGAILLAKQSPAPFSSA